MANELDKTIEELEAEVLEELEEANGNEPKPNATATDPMQKLKTNPEDSKIDSIAGSTPDKVAPHGGAAGAKGVKTDTTIPKKGKADKMDKAKEAGQNRPLASSYDPMDGYTDDEIRELCHSADHDCATFVEHPVWGKGKPVKESHAIPDAEGYVAWYDVQFKHGIEKKVMAEDMKILATEAHHEKKEMNMTKDKMITAMKDMMMGMHKEKKDKIMAAYNAMNNAMHEMGHKETEEEKEKKESVEKRL